MTTPYRVGLIVPSSNTTMETEIPAMLARVEDSNRPTFTFHSSRSRLHSVTATELKRMVDDGERCAVEIADAGVDVVGYACLVALMSQGPDYHTVAEERLSRALATAGSSAPVVTSAGALIDGIRALGATKISLLAPYMKPLTKLVVESIEAAGIEVLDARSLEISDNRAVGRIDPMALLDELRFLDFHDADAVVLSACVQCPSLPAIQTAENRIGVPVLSASTSTAFRILEELGVEPAVKDAGALLDGRRASVPVTP